MTYRPSTNEIVSSFTDHLLSLCGWISHLGELWKVKIGSLGRGRSVSLLSIKTTSGIVGLSAAWSCTHRSPICMHLIASNEQYEFDNNSSTKSGALLSLHSCHAWIIKCKYIYDQSRRIPRKIWVDAPFSYMFLYSVFL